MGSQSEHLALHIIHSHGLSVLIKALNNESNETCLSCIIWALENLTKHSVEHVHNLNDSLVFAKLLRIYISSESSPDLKCRCLSFLRSTVDKCFNIQDIELLLYESPPEILLPALKQLCKILAQDVKARRVFVSTNGLKRVQALKPPAGSELSEAVTIINSYFPEDIVRFYSPRNLIS
uniref:Sperm-associated antigen 6 n=1 Tax=Cacopsylla melanoneura TaxID=428564 RepID=A0A8D9BRZ6_9HEMI